MIYYISKVIFESEKMIMGKISTPELLDKYFESVAGTSAAKVRSQIDKPELYEYEIKIGKELIDMDVDDLFGLIFELRNKRKGAEVSFLVSHSGFDQIATQLRAIFNYYIDNIELIRNPLNDKRMKGKEATKRLAEGREPFRWDIVAKIIKDLHKDFDTDKADYLELILLLFYNGFAKAEEIVRTTEDMVDHRSRSIRLPGRVVNLSDRCYELLTKFNSMETIEGWRGNFALASWNGSYFKFIVRPNKAYELSDRPITSMCDIINRYIANDINDRYNTKINYHILYMLGFYDYIVSKYGVEKTNQMITSYRNSDDVTNLFILAREYGVNIDNVSHLKRYLRPFIEVSDDEE